MAFHGGYSYILSKGGVIKLLFFNFLLIDFKIQLKKGFNYKTTFLYFTLSNFHAAV